MSPVEPSAERAFLFRHALLRDAAYQLQMPRRRGELHALALGILEPGAGEEGAWNDLATHARIAGAALGEPAFARKEAGYLRLAAEKSERSYDLAAAQLSWTRLADLESGSRRFQALFRAGEVSRLAGGTADARRLLQAALSSAAPPSLRAATLCSLAALDYRTGRPRQGEALARRAAGIASRARDAGALAEVLQLLGIILSSTGRLREAAGVLRRGVAAARRSRSRKVEGRILVVLGHAHSASARPREACRALSRAIRLLDAAGDLREAAAARANLGLHWYNAGRMARAETLWNESQRMARESRNLRAEGLGCGNLANIYMEDGRHALAEQSLRRALEILAEVGDTRAVGVFRGNLGRLLQRMGRAAEAIPLMVEGVRSCRRLGDTGSEGVLLGVLAQAYLERGDVRPARAAWAACRRALAAAGEREALRLQLRLIEAACLRAGVAPFGRDLRRKRSGTL